MTDSHARPSEGKMNLIESGMLCRKYAYLRKNLSRQSRQDIFPCRQIFGLERNLNVCLMGCQGLPKRETRYDFRWPVTGTSWVVTASLEMSMGAFMDWVKAALFAADAVFPN